MVESYNKKYSLLSLVLLSIGITHNVSIPFHSQELKHTQFGYYCGPLTKVGNHIYVIGGGELRNKVAKLDLTNPVKWDDVCFTGEGRNVAAGHDGKIRVAN